MKRAEEYRKKAEEAETMAAATRDPGAKKAYLEIAQQWNMQRIWNAKADPYERMRNVGISILNLRT
jgi:hypothetical protein